MSGQSFEGQIFQSELKNNCLKKHKESTHIPLQTENRNSGTEAHPTSGELQYAD